MLPSSMNSTDQIELHANMNETVDKGIYTNMETIRAQTDGNDSKKQEGKLPSKSFFSENETLCSHGTLFFTTAYMCFLKLGVIFSKLYKPFLKSIFYFSFPKHFWVKVLHIDSAPFA